MKPGNLEESELWHRITTDDADDIMPPSDSHVDAITSDERELIKQWIVDGAEYEEFWAFVAPRETAVPDTDDREWSQQAIDRFVLARLEKDGLTPNGKADRRTLIRRVSFDLTGLPPTAEEIYSFLEDDSEHAYEALVDRLLTKPQFGEHMAKYWLDLVRFADTNGMHHDHYRDMTPYRDWVIRAFNKNLSFDRFIVDQVAGDLYPEPDTDQLIASGFNRLHLIIDRGTALPEESFTKNVIDRVSSVGTAFMGLTMQCAVCHDHKFDPITQKDFFQMYAFFNNFDGNPETGGRGGLDFRRGLQRPYIDLPDAEQKQALASVEAEVKQAGVKLAQLKKRAKAEVRSLEEERALEQEQAAQRVQVLEEASTRERERMSEEIRQLEQGAQKKALEESLALTEKIAEQERVALEETIALEEKHAAQRAEALGERHALDEKHANGEKRAIEARRDALVRTIPAALVMKERAEPRPANILIRGAYDQPGEQVERGTPSFLPPMETGGALKTRMDLANWLVAPSNPLTARVAVNRFWQQFFGVGLVKTSEDFGAQGEWPSHPGLLDHLTLRFVGSGWDVKSLVRSLVLSETYQQSSEAPRERFINDPENRLLSRGSRFRLDSEMIRDQILATSGLLNTTMYGRSVKPPQPEGLWKIVAMPSSYPREYRPDEGDQIYRRSVYTFWKRGLPPPQMTIFDAPTREACIARRERTNTPLQALLLMNEEQYFAAARHLVGELFTDSEHRDPEARLEHVYEAITSRALDGETRGQLLGALEEFRELYANDPPSLEALIPDVTDPAMRLEQAAWTMLVHSLYNLDATKTRE
ncbi:MAG: DUF1553 domain-containing protein [Verrucomicrobiales bacterium]